MSVKLVSKFILLSIASAAAPAYAALLDFEVRGAVLGVDGSAAAVADVIAVAPVGSEFALTFSYDTAWAPTYAFGASGTYVDAPIDATFTIGGVAFDIPMLTINVGEHFFTAHRFSLHGNVPFQAARIGGQRLFTFSLTLLDSSRTALPSASLPSMLSLDSFDSKMVQPSFAFGPKGDISFRLSLDRIDQSGASPVPEPAALSLLGVGGALLLGWRRHAHR